MQYAAQHENEGAIFFLDQEKAYDRVHHTYMKEISTALNFPMSDSHRFRKSSTKEYTYYLMRRSMIVGTSPPQTVLTSQA
jgi:hypothetical protein